MAAEQRDVASSNRSPPVAKRHGVQGSALLLRLVFGLLLILAVAGTARALGIGLDRGKGSEDDNGENFKEGIHAKKGNRDFPPVNSPTYSSY